MAQRGEILEAFYSYGVEHPARVIHPGEDVIPVSSPVVSWEDRAALLNVALNGWFTDGPYCQTFRGKLKEYLGVRHVTLCNSGSSANLLALAALAEIYPRGKVITCATGFITTVAPIVQCGFTPLFVDVNPETLNADTDDVLSVLEREDVVGVVLAHTLGFPFDAKRISQACVALGKFLLEDCCDALGATIEGRSVGSFGTVGTLSFFPAHHITAGEGGAVFVRNNGRLYQIIESFQFRWARYDYSLWRRLVFSLYSTGVERVRRV